MTTTTRAALKQARKEAFTHIVDTVLEQPADLPLKKALKELEYDSIDDLETMTEDEIKDLTYTESNGSVKDVPMKQKKKLKHVVWWRDYESAQRQSKAISPDDWKQLTVDAFTVFCQMKAATLARPSTGGTKGGSALTTTSAVSGTIVTSSQVVAAFSHGHKRDEAKYHKFDGKPTQWFCIKRQWKSQASVDNVYCIFVVVTVVPADAIQTTRVRTQGKQCAGAE